MNRRKPIENPLFHLGNRQENKIMAYLRLNCSNLKGHLYDLKIIDSPECQCRHEFENAYHYLFVCSLYSRPTTILHNTVIALTSFTLRTVLFGQEHVNEKVSSEILKGILKFITDTK